MSKKKSERKAKKSEKALGFNFKVNEKVVVVSGVILICLSLFMIISFVSYFYTGKDDQSIVLEKLTTSVFQNSSRSFLNICGSGGALLSYFLIARCFGFSAFFIPLFLFLCGLQMAKAYRINLLKCFFCGTLVMVWTSVALSKIVSPLLPRLFFNPGGDHGSFCSQWIENIIGAPGLYLILFIVALALLTYFFSETISFIQGVLNPSKFAFRRKTSYPEEQQEEETAHQSVETLPDPVVFDNPAPQTIDFPNKGNAVVNQPASEEEIHSESHDIPMDINAAPDEQKATGDSLAIDNVLSTPINPKEPFTSYKYPTLDLLKKYENDGRPYIDEKEQTKNKERIIEVLHNFGVEIKSIRATVGPTITLYEITPAEGIRISKIRNLEDDIALSLSAVGIRIIAPIPGKGTIGIEVPNAKPNIVSMESILNSKKFQETTMELPIALGKTITNEVFMADLTKIPHLLVAGATGQGKSVGLNAIITSLLYKKHPNELKFVLIDPKKVEFSVYAPIADHFMAKVPDDDEEPVITDVTKVVRTLKSLCTLMDSRYDLLKMAGVRNIKEYNNKYVNHQLDLTKGHEYMPYIVVIIDEFSDLIMTAGKEIEMPITRIAQLARAVGIHMIIATQRPTSKCITGNIKANFPGRIAFKVSAMMDSRIILDQPGAQHLIGRGDMLYSKGNDPVRVQCAFVDTPEIERINKYIAAQPGPIAPLELPEPQIDEVEGSDTKIETSSLDKFFREAAELVVASQQGSTSMIQRKFSIGYNRAGRIMDQLEKAGIVGVAQGSKPREVLFGDLASLDNYLSSLK